jgi:hypothetical protein
MPKTLSRREQGNEKLAHNKERSTLAQQAETHCPYA